MNFLHGCATFDQVMRDQLSKGSTFFLQTPDTHEPFGDVIFVLFFCVGLFFQTLELNYRQQEYDHV